MLATLDLSAGHPLTLDCGVLTSKRWRRAPCCRPSLGEERRVTSQNPFHPLSGTWTKKPSREWTTKEARMILRQTPHTRQERPLCQLEVVHGESGEALWQEVYARDSCFHFAGRFRYIFFIRIADAGICWSRSTAEEGLSYEFKNGLVVLSDDL